MNITKEDISSLSEEIHRMPLDIDDPTVDDIIERCKEILLEIVEKKKALQDKKNYLAMDWVEHRD